MYDSFGELGPILILLMIVAGGFAFFISRIIILWYLKIDQIVAHLENISKTLQKICESKDKDLEHE